MPDELSIRAGDPGDLDAVIGLFDEAIAWLVARGQTGQWGDRPFSERPERIEQFRALSSQGGLRIAERDGRVVGALILGEAPEHVAAAERSELYVVLLLTSRRHAGGGIGERLVARAIAEGRDAGREQLRVDCWAGAPSLVAWYERVGFVPSDTFELGGWRGQVLTMSLG